MPLAYLCWCDLQHLHPGQADLANLIRLGNKPLVLSRASVLGYQSNVVNANGWLA